MTRSDTETLAIPGMAYSRVSTLEQLRGGNLEDHRRALEAMARRYNVRLVRDPVLEQDSGDYDLLEGLQGLMAEVATGRNEWRVLLLKEFSRLGRSFFEVLDHARTLTEAGVRIISGDGLDTDNPMWKPIVSLLAYFAEQERARIRERTHGGKIAKLQRGNLLAYGPVGYGFRKVGEGKGATVEVDPDHERTLRRAWHLIVIDRMPLYSAARLLNLEGHLSPRGRPWEHDTLKPVLTNERLAGRWVYNRIRQPKRGHKSKRDQNEWIVLDGPRIFSDEEWALLQEAIGTRGRRARTSRADIFPLLGHVRCTRCGRAMTSHEIIKHYGDRQYRYRYYRCECHRVRADRLEDRVLAEVWAFVSEPERVIQLLRDGSEQREDRLLEISAELGDLEAQLEQKRAERKRAMHLFTSGRIDERELDEIIRPATQAIAALERRADLLRMERDSRAARGARAEQLASSMMFDVPTEPPPGALAALSHHLDMMVSVDPAGALGIRYRALEEGDFGVGDTQKTLRQQ